MREVRVNLNRPVARLHIEAREDLQEEVASGLETLEKDRVLARIWEGDHTVWKESPEEISNRLGWLESPAAMLEQVDAIDAFVGAARRDGLRQALLLGMGGSSLAAQVFRQAFGVRPGFLDLEILDSTSPSQVLSQASRIDPRRTVVLVASKSGGTVETLSLFKYFHHLLSASVGERQVGRQLVAITDPGSSLAGLGARLGFRAVFLNDPQIGGRYSALSHYGLVPAALIGVDLAPVLRSAQEMARACRAGPQDNPGARLGVVLGKMAFRGRDKLTLLLSPGLERFGDWVEQLVAESTGKDRTGILPVVGEGHIAPAQYGDDRLFVELRLKAERDGHPAARKLAQAGHPLVGIELGSAAELGGQFFLWEMATAVAGHVLGINPFDQPNVEAAKLLAREMVDSYRSGGRLPEDEHSEPSAAILIDFLEQASQGAYVAILAYLPQSPEIDRALKDLRENIRSRTRLATTVGYGPRYLHSTGQLHKGDAGRGLFVQITAQDEHALPIPDLPGESSLGISFQVLQAAQARGDRKALEMRGRPTIRFHLGVDPVSDLLRLNKELG